MTTRIVDNEYRRKTFLRFAEKHPLPFTATITKGKHRSSRQNRLQRKWLNEIAARLEGSTAEEWRGYCKLAFGVPILCAENEAFRLAYESFVLHLPYEQRLALMMEPLDMPVTRIMTTKQKKEYLDRMQRHFAERGVKLTDPEAPLWEPEKGETP